MKKVLLLLLLTILSLTSFGQIKRNVDGITLGKTSKQEVVNYFKNRGIPYTFGNIGAYNSVSSKEGRAFGGVSWQFNDYVLHNNIVFQVLYTKMSGDYITKEEIDLEFKSLFLSLQRKYGSYFKKSKSDNDTKTFSDSSIEIALRRGYYQNHYMFSIEYTDINLMHKAFSKGYDDL